MPLTPLTVILDTDSGGITVDSPALQNQLLCYGILEGGKDAIRAHHLKLAGEAPRVELAPGPLANPSADPFGRKPH